MSAPFLTLTLDLGNSRAKLRWWSPEPDTASGRSRDRTPLRALDLDAGAADSPLLALALADHPPQRAALSSVASAARTAAWSARLATAAGAPLEDPEPVLRNLCREPQRVGRDRLFAAIGALGLCGRSCLVVDAGTALTVDAAVLDAAGRSFLGGAIAPGPVLLAQALAGGTAHLPRIEPRPGVPALGRVTEEALASGVAVGFRGAAAELVREVAREADLAGAPIVLTGGARAFLLEPRPFVAGALHVCPELVHLGLLERLASVPSGSPR